MTPRFRLVLAALGLLLLCLGCFCDGPSVPERAECDGTDPAAMVDSIELDAFYMSGAQGGQMVMFDVTFRGPAPPSCASITYAFDMGAGGGGTVLIETVAVEGGVRTREPHWELWTYGDAVDVSIEAYGQTATAHVCEHSDCGDGGT